MTTLTRPLGMTQTRQLLTFPNSGYAPTVTAYLWGGGGGAGGNEGQNLGGAGTGGGYVRAEFTAVPGDTIEVTVGAAGWSGRTSSAISNTTTPIFSTRTDIPDGATSVLPVASNSYISKWSSFLNQTGVWNTGTALDGTTTSLARTLLFDQSYNVFFPYPIDYSFTLAAYYQATVYIDGVELFSSGFNSWVTQETFGVPWIANIPSGFHTVRIVARAAPDAQYGTWAVGLTINSTASAGSGGGSLTRTLFDTRTTPASPPLTIPDINILINEGKTGTFSNCMNDFGMWESDPRATSCTRTYSVYFPYTGSYTVQMCAANSATLSIDGAVVYTTPGSTSYTTAYTIDVTVSQGTHTVSFAATLTDLSIIGGVAIVISKSWSGATGGLAGPSGSSGGGGGSGGATTLVLNPGTANETLLAVAAGGAGGGGAGASTTGSSEATAPGPRGQTAAGISNGQAGQNQAATYSTAQVVGIPPIPGGTGYYTRTANPSSNPGGAREYWVVVNGALVYNSGSAPSQLQPGAYQGTAIGYSPSYPGGQDAINAFNYNIGYSDGGGGGAGGPGGPDGAGKNGYSAVGDSYGQAGSLGTSYLNVSATTDGTVIGPTGIFPGAINSQYHALIPNAGIGAAAGQIRGENGGAVIVFDAYGIQVRDDTVDGNWHDVKTAFINVDGTWRQTQAVYIYQNNTWQMVVGGAALTFAAATTDYGLLSRPADLRPEIVPVPPPPPTTYDSIYRGGNGGYSASNNIGTCAATQGLPGCSVGSGCFVKGTEITMADGSTKLIEHVEIGDQLLGKDGKFNTVLEYLRPVLGARSLIAFNGGDPFITNDHPVLMADGTWKSVDPEATLSRYVALTDRNIGQLTIGDVIATPDGTGFEITSIERHQDSEDLQLYNFALDGNHTYVANNLVVHNKGGGGVCFTADTLVTLADGTNKKISEVKIGDRVFNHNHTQINQVLFVEHAMDTSFEFLYSPDNTHAPFATANHPLYINGQLSSLDPEKTFNSYPWLGHTELIKTTNLVQASGATVYNLWTDGDHTFTVNGYGTTSMVGDGGVLRLLVEQGLITDRRASDLLISFDGLGKNTVHGLYVLSQLFGVLDIKIFNRLIAGVFADDSKPKARQVFYAVARAVGSVVGMFNKR